MHRTISSSATVREDLRDNDRTEEGEKADQLQQVVAEDADPESQLVKGVGARLFLLCLGGLVDDLRFVFNPSVFSSRDQVLRQVILAAFT